MWELQTAFLSMHSQKKKKSTACFPRLFAWLGEKSCSLQHLPDLLLFSWRCARWKTQTCCVSLFWGQHRFRCSIQLPDGRAAFVRGCSKALRNCFPIFIGFLVVVMVMSVCTIQSNYVNVFSLLDIKTNGFFVARNVPQFFFQPNHKMNEFKKKNTRRK